MAKITLNDVTSGYGSSTRINANNDAIETAFENTLSRNGTSPNGMNANIDMNSNRVVNLGSPQSSNDAARWVDVTDAVDFTGVAVPSQTGNSGRYLGTDGGTASWSNPPKYIARTAAETSASVTPSDYSYEPGDVRRYGYVADDATDNSTALANALSQMGQTGGAIVTLPSGTARFSTSLNVPNHGVIIGAGKERTILRYTGSAQAFKQATPSSRIYEIHMSDFSVYDIGTGTVGLDLESVSTSNFERMWIDGFTTGVRIHSPTSGYAVYNRFTDVTTSSGASTKGFVLSGTSSNANTFIACRANFSSTTSTIGWEITDSNGNQIVACHPEGGATAVYITATSPGLSGGNVVAFNRFEAFTTGINIASANVEHTRVIENHYTIVTTPVSDSGTRSVIDDPVSALMTRTFPSTLAASANGTMRFVRDADGGASLPFTVLRDSASGSGTPVTLQIETERATGSFIRGRRSSTTYYDVRADGTVAILSTGVLRAVGAGSPEGVLTAPVGSTYQRTDGGAGTCFYVKESGSGNTGWVAK